MPIGDAVVVAEVEGPFAVHARHFPWSGVPTVATAIAVRPHEDIVIEYDAPLKQYRNNGRLFDAEVGKVYNLGRGCTFTRTADLSFTVVAYNQAKTVVTDAGGSMPYLNVVITTPRSVTNRLGKGTCGSMKTGDNVIVEAHDIFTTPYDKDQVHYNVVVTADQKTKEDAYKACAKLNGHAFDSCVYDFEHTPKGHRHNIVKKSVAAHKVHAKIVTKIVQKLEKDKKKYEKKVLKVIQKLVKKHPQLKAHCQKAASRKIRHIVKKVALKHHKVGVKKLEKQIKKLVRKQKKAVHKRVHKMLKKLHAPKPKAHKVRKVHVRRPRIVRIVKRVVVQKQCASLRAKYNRLKLKFAQRSKAPRKVSHKKHPYHVHSKVMRRVPHHLRSGLKKTFKRLYKVLRKSKKALKRGGKKARHARKSLVRETKKLRKLLKRFNGKARKGVKKALRKLIKKAHLKHVAKRHHKRHSSKGKKCGKVHTRRLVKKLPRKYRKAARKQIKRLLKTRNHRKVAEKMFRKGFRTAAKKCKSA